MDKSANGKIISWCGGWLTCHLLNALYCSRGVNKNKQTTTALREGKIKSKGGWLDGSTNRERGNENKQHPLIEGERRRLHGI